MVQAIAYFRMAEFFMFDGNPKKLEIYRKARTLFYQHYAALFENDLITRKKVTYENYQLPVWIAQPEKVPAKDIILLHGGNDSYMEEFLPMVLYLQQNGYAVYLFEGLGQGEVFTNKSARLPMNGKNPLEKSFMNLTWTISLSSGFPFEAF